MPMLMKVALLSKTASESCSPTTTNASCIELVIKSNRPSPRSPPASIPARPCLKKPSHAISGDAFPAGEFDALFADKYYVTKEAFNPDFEMKGENKYGYKTITRDEIKKAHQEYHAKGTKVSLVHANQIAIGCIEAELELKNGDEESRVKMVFSVADGKIVHGREVSTVTLILRAHHAHVVGNVVGMFGFLDLPHPKKGEEAPTFGLDEGPHPQQQ